MPKDLSGSPRWVKTGVEFTHGAPHISTVSCDRWADWSLAPLEGSEVTVELEREVKHESKTPTLWIYAVDVAGNRRPIREITWVFENAKEDGPDDEQVCWVGAYAAKPMKDEVDAFRQVEVHFRNMFIETWEGPLKI